MIYVGVDPGKKGGFAMISNSPLPLSVALPPVVSVPHETSLAAGQLGGGSSPLSFSSSFAAAYYWNNDIFVEKMSSLKDEEVIACVEWVWSRPGQSISAMFNFGKSAGFIEGVLAAYHIPCVLITPQKWKSFYGLHEDKQESIDMCQKLFPTVSLLPTSRCKTPSDGMAEALLIGAFGYHNDIKTI